MVRRRGIRFGGRAPAQRRLTAVDAGSTSPPVTRENHSHATQENDGCSRLCSTGSRPALRMSHLRGRARLTGGRPARRRATVKPVEVVRTNDYTEGVVVDHDGNLYFSHEKIVTKVTPDGKASTWAQTGSPNGHKILADGTHLICDASRHALLHLAADGSELKPAATESDGKPLRGPERPDARHRVRRCLLHRPGELG